MLSKIWNIDEQFNSQAWDLIASKLHNLNKKSKESKPYSMSVREYKKLPRWHGMKEPWKMNQATGHTQFCQLHPTNKSAVSCWISIQSGWNRKEKELLRNAKDVDYRTFLSSFKQLSLRLSSTLAIAAKRTLFGLIAEYLLYSFMFLFHSLLFPMLCSVLLYLGLY